MKLPIPAIDCHAHIGHFEGYDLSESTLVSELEEASIDLALVSNIDGATVSGKTRGLNEAAANAETAAVVARHPERLRGLVWGRPDGGLAHVDVLARMTERAALTMQDMVTPSVGSSIGTSAEGSVSRWTSRLFVGMKLHPEMNQYPADASEVDVWMEAARHAGWPVVVHSDGQVDEASPERIHALARRHPDVPVVLYHTGFQGPHELAIEAAASALETGDATLWLETAQLPPEAALLAVERVGSGRVLFGTDATFYGRGHYRRYEPLMEAILTLDPGAARAILRENALTLFGLKPTSTPTITPKPQTP